MVYDANFISMKPKTLKGATCINASDPAYGLIFKYM